jgi:hypothetical protein
VVRPTDDRELILCNLAIRRETYQAHGGLDERLYPNEENKLIDALLAAGCRLYHDPDLAVHRSQRPTVRAFLRQMTTYGRGRAEQTLLARTLSFKPVLPALFCCYLLFLPLLVLVGTLLPDALLWTVLAPALLYGAAVAGSSLHAWREAGAGVARRLLLIYPALHLSYGAGFLAGLVRPRFRRQPEPATPVTLRRVRDLEGVWS